VRLPDSALRGTVRVNQAHIRCQRCYRARVMEHTLDMAESGMRPLQHQHLDANKIPTGAVYVEFYFPLHSLYFHLHENTVFDNYPYRRSDVPSRGCRLHNAFTVGLGLQLDLHTSIGNAWRRSSLWRIHTYAAFFRKNNFALKLTRIPLLC